ncbi:AzlD domain-containing protein [Sporomusa sp.]|uniref:AzlD domain-containing protein n=1 Tax=Sporomusa sp. TaxID=2078658 RepID=UPI002CCC533A|nr:AzlD domain-containing protein [Sporomusa sp.]HWR44132.1 AzlD domain-containing protein [Sporomusa sp.]
MRTEYLLIICVMALAAACTRLGSIILFDNVTLPLWAQKWLKHLPASVFTALAIPAILLPKSHLDISFDNHYLLASIIAVIIAWRYKKFVLTVGGSTIVMLCLRWLNL